jgi:hypothetical protein
MMMPRRTAISFFALICIFIFGCSEELPEYIEPEIPMEVSLYTKATCNLAVGRKYPKAKAFHFMINQFYEEVLEEEHYFWGSLDIWVVDRPELSRHIDRFDNRPSLMYTI